MRRYKWIGQGPTNDGGRPVAAPDDVGGVSVGGDPLIGETNGGGGVEIDFYNNDHAGASLVRVARDVITGVASNGGDGIDIGNQGTLSILAGPSLDPNTFGDSVGRADCYVRGTRILTPGGEIAIEDLRIGDLVTTHAGAARKIRWIGWRSYGGLFAARNPDVLPVVIRAGALADGVPCRDLTVSPRHAMFVDGLLIPAIGLVNGVSIIQAKYVDKVEYFHIELDTHDVVLADGAPSESFVDDGSRMLFHNAADHAALYPDAVPVPARYCAPRVTEGFALAAIRARLAARGVPRPDTAAAPLRGYLDRVGRTLIEGWAQNPDRPEAPVCLDVLVDGVVVARTLANRPRADVAAAGFGSGRHGFSVRLPTPLTPDARATVTVRRSSDHRALPRSAGAPATAPPNQGAAAW